MVMLGGEGWDMYNGASAEIGYLSKWTNYATRAGSGLVAGRFGGQAIRLTDGTGGGVTTRFGYDLGASYGSFTFGMAFNPRSANASANFLLFQTAAGSLNQLYVSHGVSDKFSVQRGDGTTIIPNTAFTTTVGQWCYVEVAFTIANSGGTVELYVNGVLEGSYTGDTQQQATADFRYIEIRSCDDTGSGNAIDMDDMYWRDDLVSCGEIRVATLRAIADTADADFVPVGASPNSACVDETLVDGDTTYVQGSNSGDLDRYEFDDAPGDPSSIFGVQLVTFARKTDAGARTLEPTLDSNGSIATGPPVNLLTTYDRYDHMVELDPDGSVPWTKASVDAILAGPQIP